MLRLVTGVKKDHVWLQLFDTLCGALRVSLPPDNVDASLLVKPFLHRLSRQRVAGNNHNTYSRLRACSLSSVALALQWSPVYQYVPTAYKGEQASP